jgi:hypothetical protein
VGTALDRLADRLTRSPLVELATRVRSHLRKTSGGITDVEAYMRSVEHLNIPIRSRSAITRRPGQPKPGEAGYTFSPRRGEMGPSPLKSSRLLAGTTETRLERRQRLQAKLVDYKTDRPLEGGEDIRKVIPGTKVKEYLDLPFLDVMHSKMGIDIDTISTEEYTKKRNDLFSEANTKDEEVPFDGLVVTQPVVNRAKARKLIGQEFKPPPYVVRYRGTNYVINGHHRVVAEALAEKKGTRARVLELS